ncbi:hypothetical protein [Butyrivibrio sp. AC2005]|uniref:hypothetical protein n=1 Tax=Butyrivibrio sp. AC2005 TaxID=1280672 RepID=UPI0003F5694F|nr:hypothetical protein [Butyrivibrio sp. AC2005]
MQQHNKLRIDPDVSVLFLPPDSSGINLIRENIRLGISPAPFPVWNNILMDRIHEYKEYADAGFNIKTQTFSFRSKNAMLASICQLLATDIAEMTQYKSYLIGKQYQYHKAAYDKGEIETSCEHISLSELKKKYSKDIHPLTVDMVDLYGISSATIHEYARYASSIDRLRERSPELVTEILSGLVTISKKAVSHLCKLVDDDFTKSLKIIEREKANKIHATMLPGYTPVKIDEPQHLDNRIIPEIKQMPKFDPDGYVSSLSLTIPSWSDTIRRVRDRSNMSDVSPGAAKKLIFQLGILERNIQIIRTELEGITEDAN